MNVPICIGDTVINPGDYIFGDEDGVVAVPQQDLETVLIATQERADTEATYREKIKQGGNTVDLMGLREAINQL